MYIYILWYFIYIYVYSKIPFQIIMKRFINNNKNNINFRNRFRNNRRRRQQRNINNRFRYYNNRLRNKRINRNININNMPQKKNNTNNNNITKKIDINNKKISKLSEDLSKLSLSMFPKTTNIYRKLKEPRVDKLVTPMEMGLSQRFTSIFKTGNRIRYMSLYNRFEINNSTGGLLASFLWFPYSVNFQSYPDLAITVSDGNSGTVQPDTINPLIRIISNPITETLSSINIYNCSSCGLVGNYRIVGCTLKLQNLTPFNSKGGSYIIYKLNENTVYPPFYNNSLQPSSTNCPDYSNTIFTLSSTNHDQVMLKQSFSASDVAYINEFNVYEGNNIFQTPQEYIGQEYISGVEPVALWNGNPQGNNIKYQIDIQSTAQQQSYLLETWQIIEIVPDPGLNLDNITDFQTHVFDEKVIDEIRRKMPIVKG